MLLGKLGDPYRVNRIDGANCIYRDFGDHDVEICGGRTKRAIPHLRMAEKAGYGDCGTVHGSAA